MKYKNHLQECDYLKNTEAPLLVDSLKVILTPADGTKMKCPTNQRQRCKGAIYSDGDLTINGKGSLIRTVPQAMRLNRKTAFALRMTVTTTAKHGIAANDFVNVSGATLNLSADEDGIHSDNEDDISYNRKFIV